MPRVKTLRKNKGGKEHTCGRCGKVLQPGEMYHRYKFRYGGMRYRCSDHYPRRSELTMSKMSGVYAAMEDAEDSLGEATTADEFESLVQAVAEVVQEAVDEYTEAAEAFGQAGENQERADELDSWLPDLDGFQSDYEDPAEGEAPDEDALEDARQQVRDALDGCPL